MEAGYEIKSLIGELPNFIYVKNVHSLNYVSLYGFNEDIYKDKNDDGVWRIKYKSETTQSE